MSLQDTPVLIIGDLEHCLDALIVAALRRLQHWAFTGILAEFRTLTGRSIFDFEQAIEALDLSIIRIPRPAPQYITAYEFVKQEEAAALVFISAQGELESSKSNFLKRMYSNDLNVVASPDIVYDPNLRYQFTIYHHEIYFILLLDILIPFSVLFLFLIT
jgi:hypothetical protein